MKVVILLLFFILPCCASPNVWVQEVTPRGGVIGYQNYDPRSDNQARINALVHCRDHTMTWSGLKSAAGAPGYLLMNNMLVPISGDTQWAEYHYSCNP